MLNKIKQALTEWDGEGHKEMIEWLDNNVRKSQKINSMYFVTLAEGLRELWPAGEKEVYDKDKNCHTYPWRDSVSNLTRRLQNLWDVRELKQYPLETCLTVARRYLSQYEDNAKYMQTLKYFILKQEDIVGKDGRKRHTDKSVFADMLESNSTFDEWNTIFDSSNTYEQGELI